LKVTGEWLLACPDRRTIAMKFELTISCDNDAHSGVYDTYREARAAACAAAAIDGLVPDVQTWTKLGAEIVSCTGVFIEPTDEAEVAWFDFRVEQCS
jgi:hypothetical protein